MLPSVVVNNFNFMRIAVTPSEAYFPLVVDPNTTLACPIAGRNPEVFEAPGCMKIKQFAAGDALYGLETEHLLISKQQLSIAAMERPDQTRWYYAYGIPSSVTDWTR